jgi:glycine/D-amino acid oxidase-like deaminating enzyme/predicted ATP-dependent endonuclease of OLD family
VYDPAPARCDLAVIGGGIVGLAVARELARRHPRASLCVLEREQRLAAHQTGHSSGVIHAGIYYRPGSLKARLCVDGAHALYAYCEERGIAHERCGKLVLATDARQLAGLDELERRGRANGVAGLRRLGGAELELVEPSARALAALHSPNTGVVDFAAVAHSYAVDVAEAGGSVSLGCGVTGVDVRDRALRLSHAGGQTEASNAIFCAGAWSDRLAVAAGAAADPRIVPFRGAYLRLLPERREIPPGSARPRWLKLSKIFGGAVESSLLPPLRRDRTARERVASELRRIRASRWIGSHAQSEEDGIDAAAIDQLLDGLDDGKETLSPETIEWARNLAKSFDAFLDGAPKYARGLPDDLRALADQEEAPHPTVAAREILNGRIPPIVRFELEARELSSDYNLQTIAQEGTPLALQNFARLANLEVRHLYEAIAADDGPLALELIDSANRTLQERISEAWDQSKIETRLDTDGFVLHIYVRTEDGMYHDIAERSDGLRAFLALVAFTQEHAANTSPILLIDEAEIHLHYDAQADLIQMLGRQKQARQVIYTTHSAGCLPQDLGTGVRLVEPIPDSDRSTVTNWPWEKEGGFGPLLLGMGASTMAFVPTRAAVIAEGACEIVLMPTLLRQATGSDVLPYQIAPGAAEATPGAIKRLDRQGSGVLWLVDGDAGGAVNRANLAGNEIPPERIVTLGGPGSGFAVEDLLSPDVYAAAVNEELRRSLGDQAAQLVPHELPASGRPGFVSAWCADRSLPEPNKGAIAHRAADARSERKIGSELHAPLLQALHAELLDLLDIKPDDVT